jgi:hypothetical protein
MPGNDKDENMCVLGFYLGENEYEMSEEAAGIRFKMHEPSTVFGNCPRTT